jgi:hypothetical protein
MTEKLKPSLLKELDRPMPGVMRAALIQEALAKTGDLGGTRPVVVATGKTGAGKSTLGNLLVGVDDLLRSTGHIDCTDSVNVVSFARGFDYVDLPGVASNDKFENINHSGTWGCPRCRSGRAPRRCTSCGARELSRCRTTCARSGPLPSGRTSSCT